MSTRKKKVEVTETSLKNILKMVEITPLKDHLISHNQWNIDLKEGVSVPIPQIFLSSMVTEGVIKKIPKINME